MRKLNNNGYVLSLILFGILLLFIVVLSILLITMNNSNKISRTIKENIIEKIEY